MRSHGIAFWRWLTWRRLQLATGGALVLAAALLLFAGPALLVIAAVEWKYTRRRSRVVSLALFGLLARALVWLWKELRGLPHRHWHPCAQCGAPIEAPSRASYCSPSCRRYARLGRDARSPDPWLAERAETRLRLVTRTDAADPESSEIPF
jgi:predicted nucleic acid-binding Zn ribbon protein